MDVNREAYELDPPMFSDALPVFVNAASPRIRMGLGTIARVVASGEEIYAKKLRFVEARGRIECFYEPYHQELRRLVAETEFMFSGCLLIDCHSIPSAADSACGLDGADIVLDDCHGVARAPQIFDAARRFLVERISVVAVNAPYAGGFTTVHDGRPSQHRHALQIEISRALYMDEGSYRRKPRFAQPVEDVAELLRRLGQVAQDYLAKTV